MSSSAASPSSGGLRVEIADARDELARNQDRAREVPTTVAEMAKKGLALDAKGVRFEITRCHDDKGGKPRLCVQVDPKAPEFSGPDGRQYRVPIGF